MTRLIILITSFFPVLLWGQAPESIIKAPETWNSELIEFPLSFAPDIKLKGFEDIRFAPGWSDPSSDQFWTYHFTWCLEDKKDVTEDFLEETMRNYFDGLMKLVLEEQSDQLSEHEFQKTTCLFIKTNGGFRGRIKVFDSFFTKDYILLNVKVFQQFCSVSEKQLISFNLSPKRFDDPVWNIFNDVEIIEECN